MNNSSSSTGDIATEKARALAVKSSALLLFLLGCLVLLAWHKISALSAFYTEITSMAYNTALCFVISSLALFFLNTRQKWPTQLCASLIIIICSLTLLNLYSPYSTHINLLLSKELSYSGKSLVVMVPTTALCFFFCATGLLITTNAQIKIYNHLVIVATFLNLIVITIGIISLLSHSIGLNKAFIWLGITMAPHTAVGLILLAATIIFYSKQQTLAAFNHFAFFNRMMIGFAFMSVLASAIGGVSYIQIKSISNITHELYQNPLQINYSVLHLKSSIGKTNRDLKNIAIQPDMYSAETVLTNLNKAKEDYLKDTHFMINSDGSLEDELAQLNKIFLQWQNYIFISHQLLEKKDYEAYKRLILNQGQQTALEISAILDGISLQQQTRISNLDDEIRIAEADGLKVVTFIIFNFILVGIAIASLITRSLNAQLQKIRHAMIDIAHEKLDTQIPPLGNDSEMGDMIRALILFEKSTRQRLQLEHRLRQVIEATPNGIIMVNAEGVIEIVNAQAESIFGYLRSELLGKPIEILIPQRHIDKHPNNRMQFFNNPSARLMGAGRELFGLHREGHEIPIEIGLSPIETDEGLKVLAAIVDISERQKVFKAMNESRERLELTARANQIGIWEYDTEKDTLNWDDTMFEIYGRDKERFSNNYNAWKKCVHVDDIETLEKKFFECLNTLTPLIAKFRIILPDGSTKHVHAKAKLERKAGSNCVKVLGTNIDITREEIAFSKLHNLEVLRSAIVEFSEDAIISKTPYGIVTSWNIGASKLFGYSSDEAIGKKITELVCTTQLRDEEENLLMKVRAGEIIKHYETLRQHKDGRIINVSISLSPIKDRAGNIVGISAIKRDITDAIKAKKLLAKNQHELEKSNKDLIRSNKELETFAYVASHDLKSPLRGITQLSTWIEEDIAAHEFSEVGNHTKLLRNRIQRMEKLLDDLLIFYRAGKIDGNETAIDIRSMAEELFEIQNTKSGLHLKLDNTLPIFSTLSTPFEQVLRNLISNAIKHHDRDQGFIQINCKDINEYFYEFSVIDDGPGIPAQFQQRIFGMFQTLKPRDELEGSGMGLALIKKIVEAYGGKINLISEGRGSCFSFTWPKHIKRNQSND